MKFYKTKYLGPKLVFPPILVVNWVSSPLSSFVSASTAATYIFTAPTCTITIINVEPCALDAEFQYFILRFNKNFLTLGRPLKERIRGESRGDTGWKRGWLYGWIYYIVTLLIRKKITFDTKLHETRVIPILCPWWSIQLESLRTFFLIRTL
jgi:hypothetical protein